MYMDEWVHASKGRLPLTLLPFISTMVIMFQICIGMMALVEEKIIHRDLAARNILVFRYDPENPQKTCVKVSDFGLAVDLYGRAYKTVDGDDALPFR